MDTRTTGGHAEMQSELKERQAEKQKHREETKLLPDDVKKSEKCWALIVIQIMDWLHVQYCHRAVDPFFCLSTNLLVEKLIYLFRNQKYFNDYKGKLLASRSFQLRKKIIDR